MAPSLIQNANAHHGFTTGNAVITFGTPTTAGNTLIIAVKIDSDNQVFTVTDSASNTWTYGTTNVTSQNPPVAADNTNQNYAFIGWTFNAASVTTVTVTNPVPTNSWVVYATASEWSGLASRTSSSAGNGTGSGGQNISPPAVTLATSADVVICACGAQFESSETPSAPMTAFNSDTSDQTSYGQPGSAGSFTPVLGFTGHAWVGAAAVFTVPAAASGGVLLGAWP